MKMLVTGGAGFIGSHLCDKYVKEGHTVFCLDNFMSGNLINIRHLLDYRNFKLVKGDIRDFDLLEKIMRDVDVVFHLAAQIHVDRSYIEPRLTYDINVIGTQNILEVARIYDAKKVIYASTSEVYGSAQYAPIDEKHPLSAPHPYGASKIAADRMCYAYTQTYGMNISILRLFNVFGSRQRDFGYGGVISIFTRRDHEEPIPEPVNFGSGREVSILDLANMIIDLCGKSGDVKPIHVEPRIGEVERLIADATKAKNLLGWEPKVSLKEGLRAFVQWYRNYGFEERMKLG